MSRTKYKVLRLFEAGNTGEDWHTRSTGYTKEEIANINDPAISSRKEITSIPSPFARIHLFENAFSSVATRANVFGGNTLKETSAYHQLVSDALDVAETFFNYEVFNQTRNNLHFVTWNKDKELARLKSDAAHARIGETLALFLDQDSHKTQFDKIDNFYLLFCNNTLVGGTSPSTLFFSAYNEGFRLSSLGLKKGDDLFFDDSPRALYLRDLKFLSYLYGLFKVHSTLKEVMAPFWKYLEVNLKFMEKERNRDWNELQNTILKNHDYNIARFEDEFKAAVTDEENSFIAILSGIHHRRLKGGSQDYSQAPFAIKSTKFKGARTPLALQNNFAKPLSYCGGIWKSDTKVPYSDPAEWDKRELPGTSEAYPYLTVSDFLEDNILKLTYPIETDFFFNGNPEGYINSLAPNIDESGKPDDDSLLLPLTKLFFEFFDPEYLQQNTPDGRPVFRMIKTGTESVEVQLLVPIQSGDYILFKRLYRPNQTANPEKNEGGIIESRFDLGFLPLVHVEKQVKQIVMLTDGDTQPATRHYNYNLEFFTSDLKRVGTKTKNRQDKIKHQQYITSKYFMVDEYYDFIRVSNGKQNGIIIPKWLAKPKGNKGAVIAIDFGTTNSFVSVSIDGEEPQPLEITEKDRFLVTLSKSWAPTRPFQLKDVILRSFLPFTLGKKQECFLPMRTVISEIEGINHGEAEAGTNISIPFFFERRLLLLNEDTVTNLKWLKMTDEVGVANKARVESYIGFLLFLSRIYVQNRGASLDKVHLVWLYPSSMSEQSKSIFGRVWEGEAKKYLGENVKIERHSEAIAPFYAYGHHVTKAGERPVLNIDIGGGTTDVVIIQNDAPVYSSSFRFAGNTIFGNGDAATNLRINGLVRLFKTQIDQWFDNNSGKIFNLNDAYRGEMGISKMGSADINSFYFSIEHNKEVSTADIKPISYVNILSDREDIKVGFLFFYTAIVYHLAKLMRELKLPIPRQLAFSGKGAGIITLLDAHPKQQNAAALAELIFNKVYEEEQTYPERLEILIGESPKESTCYGAIKMVKDGVTITEPPIAVLVDSEHFSLNEQMQRGTPLRYKDIDEAVFSNVSKDIKEFIDFFFDLNKSFGFAAKFGALTGDKLAKCKEVMSADLINNLKVGLAERKKTVDTDEPISESLFFYPLVGSLFQLFSYFADTAGKPKNV